jgi:hypothetical protein
LALDSQFQQSLVHHEGFGKVQIVKEPDGKRREGRQLPVGDVIARFISGQFYDLRIYSHNASVVVGFFTSPEENIRARLLVAL